MTTMTNAAPAVPKKPKGGVNIFGPQTPAIHTNANTNMHTPSKHPNTSSNMKLVQQRSNSQNYSDLDAAPLPDVVSNAIPPMTPTKPTKHSAPINSEETTPKPVNLPPKKNYIHTDAPRGYLDTNDSALFAAALMPKKITNFPSVEDRRSSLKKVEVNDFAPPEPNFGKNLAQKSGIEFVGKMMDEEIAYLKNWKRYLEDRTRIEQNYYKSMLELHEKNSSQSTLASPEIHRETFNTFPAFIDTSQQYIESVGQSINSLNKETIPAIKSLISSKKSVKEVYTAQCSKIDREKHLYSRKMEDSRRQYCELYKEVETTKVTCSNAIARNKNQDKMRKSFLAKAHEMVEAHNTYVLALKACDIYEQWYYESLLPMLLNTYQRILMLQTDYYSSFYDCLVSALHGKLDPACKLLRQLIVSGAALNGDIEYEHVINEKGVESLQRTPLLYDRSLPKHPFIDLIPDQVIIQNRDVLIKLKTELQAAFDEHQKNKQSKYTELTYMDKAITSTQGGHKPITAYPFDINELCGKFAGIMLEMQMECYKQEICQVQLKLVEGALGATDGTDVNDAELLERAFHERVQHSKTMGIGSANTLEQGKLPIKRRFSFNETRERNVNTIQRPATPPEPEPPGRTLSELPIEEEPWYFGEISRDEAEKLLVYDGDYLVRFSSGQKGFVISTKCKGLTKHFVVKKENGLYMFNKQGFFSIRCLLEHQQIEKQPLIGEFYLQRPITRNEGDKWEITEKDLDILEKIGKGNFGYVYKGYMRSRGQHIAIKMCKSDALTDQDEFLREAEILKQYRHPNIVEFIGVSQQAESIYIIMELMCGGDFLTFLRNKAIREKKHLLSRMVLDVSEGMAYLSSMDCVHRDLAARNCLIGEGKSVKISDFGMSRQLSEGEYQMSTTNKPLPIKWTAPEALHKGLYTCQSDIWSYGILLWETFSCGSTPYPGMDSKTAIEKLETGFRLPAPSSTPPDIYALMRSCWEYSPHERPRFRQIVDRLKVITEDLRSKNI